MDPAGGGKSSRPRRAIGSVPGGITRVTGPAGLAQLVLLELAGRGAGQRRTRTIEGPPPEPVTTENRPATGDRRPATGDRRPATGDRATTAIARGAPTSESDVSRRRRRERTAPLPAPIALVDQRRDVGLGVGDEGLGVGDDGLGVGVVGRRVPAVDVPPPDCYAS
jgi:hypothetical protein